MKRLILRTTKPHPERKRVARVRLEHLIEEAKEGAAQAEDALAAVSALVDLGEQARGQVA